MDDVLALVDRERVRSSDMEEEHSKALEQLKRRNVELEKSVSHLESAVALLTEQGQVEKKEFTVQVNHY